MKQLILLTLNKSEFLTLHKQALSGDKESIQILDSLWDGYLDVDLSCFACDGLIDRPVFTQVFPERFDPDKLIAAPLCPSCGNLTPMQKWGKCIKVLKRMWKNKLGRPVAFHFNRPTR